MVVRVVLVGNDEIALADLPLPTLHVGEVLLRSRPTQCLLKAGNLNAEINAERK